MSLAHPALEVLDLAHKNLNPYSRFDNYLLAFELILRVDALVCAARFIDTDCRDDKIRLLLLKSRFLLSDWYALLQTLVTVMKHVEFHELSGWFVKMDHRCKVLNSAECRASPLQTLLNLRNRRAHQLDRMHPEFVGRCSPVAECCIQKLLEGHPSLGTFDINEEGRVFYRTSECAALPCWPFILPGRLKGRSDDLLFYSGNSTRVFEYESQRAGVYSSPEIHDLVIDSLKHRYSSLEHIYSTANPFTLCERLYEITMEAVLQTQQIGQYRPSRFLHRAEPDAVFESFLSGSLPLMVIEGPVGSGKTSWICSLAEQRIAAKSAVLLAPVDRLSGVKFPDILGDYMRIEGEIGTALERLAVASTDHRVVIFIDDLGVAGQEQHALAHIFNWVSRLAAASQVRIVVTIRSEQLQCIRQSLSSIWNPSKAHQPSQLRILHNEATERRQV